MTFHNMSSTKDRNRIPFAAKKPRKKKPKDKPKRPLSAYNYFFREEREKITRFLLNKDDTYGVETGLDPAQTRELMTENGKVKFEEVGKLIGKRWKSLAEDSAGEEKVKRYSSLAATDAERYKKELREYNENKSKQEAAAAEAYQQQQAQQAANMQPDDSKRGGRGGKNMISPYGSSYQGKRDPMIQEPHHPGEMNAYGNYPPPGYGNGGGPGSMYFSSYPSQGPSGPGSYPPPSSMPPGGQGISGGYSPHYHDSSYSAGQQMDGRMQSYGSPSQSQYASAPLPQMSSSGGSYGGDPVSDQGAGGYRTGSRSHGGSSTLPPPSSSTYHPNDPSLPPSMPPPAYDEPTYEGQSYLTQSQPYPGSSHYPSHGASHGGGQQYQGGGGSYPPQSVYGHQWGPPGYGGDGKSQQHWGGPPN